MKAVDPSHTFSIGSCHTHVYHADAGEGIPKHEHSYPHITYCAAGSIRVSKQDKQAILVKNSTPIMLRAGEWHEIEALSENTVFVNVFAVETACRAC